MQYELPLEGKRMGWWWRGRRRACDWTGFLASMYMTEKKHDVKMITTMRSVYCSGSRRTSSRCLRRSCTNCHPKLDGCL